MRCSDRVLSAALLLTFVSVHAAVAEPAPDTLPSGYAPVYGSSSYSTDGNVGTLVSSGAATVGHWDSFSIGSQAAFNAQIEGAHLSKVVGQNPSEIFGSLNVQSGKFFLVNPNGIVFGPGSQVNAPGLVASTLNILENDFVAGRYDFNALAGSNGSLTNRGTLEAEPGGYVALIGRSVSNEGVINATGGGAVLAAGDEVTLSLDGNGLVSAAVKAPVQAEVYDLSGNKVSDTLSNTGAIDASGGYVVLTAKSAENVFDNVINHSGVITADKIENKDGVIRLMGGTAEGVVRISGELKASAGDIQVTGNKVGLFDGARLDVSDASGGGEVRLGEGSSMVFVSPDATIDARATVEGDGGSIILWSDDATRVYGHLNADGGVLGGDGGLIETSGKNFLDVADLDVSARSFVGEAGTWLLDPHNVVLTVSVTSGGTFTGNVFTPTADNATVDVATDIVSSRLNAGTSVTINTGASGVQIGDITVASPVSKTAGGAATLTLSAAGNIFINESITSTLGPLGVIMTASGGNITVGNNVGDTINSNGANVTLTAASGTIMIQDGGIQAGAGTVGITGLTINGTGASAPYITASTVSLSSTSGIGTSGVFKIDAANLTNASASGTGLINIADASGGLNVTTASTTLGNITLGAAGGNLIVGSATAPGSGNTITLNTTTSGDVVLGVANAQNQVFVNSAGAILDNTNDATADISVTNSVTLTAVSGIGSSSTGSIDMNSPTTTASVSSAGGISLDLLGTGTKTLTSISTNNGDIDITSADSLSVGQVSAGTGGTAGSVFLEALTGTIRDNTGTDDSLADIIGDFAWVSAVSGVGEAGASGSFDVNVNDMFAETTSGGIFVNLLNTAVPSNGLAANHSTSGSFDVSGTGNIVISGSAGAGDRFIFGATTFAGGITIGAADGDLYVDSIFSDTGISGVNDILIQANGPTNGDLLIGYIQSDDLITLTSTNGAILDLDFDFLNLSAGGLIDLNAAGNVGAIDDPIEYSSLTLPDVSGVAGTDYLVACDSAFCGELADYPFLDAILASFSALYSESFDGSDAGSSEGSFDEGTFGEDSGTGDEDSEGEKDEDASASGSTGQTQTEQQKDIENDAPAGENVTVNAQTFNPC